MAEGSHWHEFVISSASDYHEVEMYLRDYCPSTGSRYIDEGTGTSIIRTNAPLRALIPRVRRATGVRLKDAMTCLCDADMTAETGDDMARCYETTLHLGKNGQLYCLRHLAQGEKAQ